MGRAMIAAAWITAAAGSLWLAVRIRRAIKVRRLVLELRAELPHLLFLFETDAVD
jgi:hypothetical protein